MLDHDSAEMTAHYARLHDDTVRRHWERARKVDINGNNVTISPDSPLADAEWTKQHLSRATRHCPTATVACRCNKVAHTPTPDLPGLHHHTGVPTATSRAARTDPRHHRTRTATRTAAARRNEHAHRRQPHQIIDQSRRRCRRSGRVTMMLADNSAHLRAAAARSTKPHERERSPHSPSSRRPANESPSPRWPGRPASPAPGSTPSPT